MKFLFTNLVVQYPAINKILFKVILENTLAFVNILKLLTNYTPYYEKMDVFKVNNTLTVDILEKDSLVSKIKSLSDLFQYFFLYSTIFLYFIPSAI